MIDVRSNATTDHIVLEVAVCDQRRSYRVTFEGPQAEDMALSFIEGRSKTHAFHEVEESPFNIEKYERLYGLLYPSCEHGLSLSNCYGPQHYYFDQDEQAAGFRNGW